MADPTADFFQALSQRGHEPTLSDVNAKIRFDVTDGEAVDHWLVGINNGDIQVARGKSDADCVVRVDRRLFEAITSGQANPMAAMLRGEVVVTGDLELLVLTQKRLFPAARPEPQPAATGRR